MSCNSRKTFLQIVFLNRDLVQHINVKTSKMSHWIIHNSATIFAFVFTVDVDIQQHTCPSGTERALVDGTIKVAVTVLFVRTGAHVRSHEGHNQRSKQDPVMFRQGHWRSSAVWVRKKGCGNLFKLCCTIARTVFSFISLHSFGAFLSFVTSANRNCAGCCFQVGTSSNKWFLFLALEFFWL